MIDAKGSVDPELCRRLELDGDAYPCPISSASFALNDYGYQQQILSKPSNFAENTNYDMLIIDEDGRGVWHKKCNDDDLVRHIQVPSIYSKIAARVFFFTFEDFKGATFGCQLSLKQDACLKLLGELQVRPEFCPLMLGQFVGNHLPPADFQKFDTNGDLEALDFICQQPRWGFRNRKWPISTWMSFQDQSGIFTCIVTAGSGDERMEIVQTRLNSVFCGTAAACGVNSQDPFLLPSLVSHECFMHSDSSVFDLGSRLYDAIDLVDAASEGTYDRDNVQSVTFKLHQISQDADALIGSADMGIALAESMLVAQENLALWSSNPKRRQRLRQSVSAAEYLKKAFQARKRWLLGAKSRKETTMSLVYNLVSQKEAETNIAIARDTKNDSSSMKTIAVLTMVFLPASAVSSFFGMAFFNGESGKLTVTSEWWLFIVITAPLTLAVLGSWKLWEFFGMLWPQPSGILGRRLVSLSLKAAKRKIKQEDLEKG